MAQYDDILTEGHKAMFRTYPGYFMDVYPTRRSAAMPERIYEATKRIAATTHLIEGGNGFSGGAEGIPFPIPENGTARHLEPHRPLSHRQRPPHHRPGAGDPRRQLHDGDVHRRVPRRLRPGRRPRGRPQQRHHLLQADRHRAGAPGRRGAAGARDAEPGAENRKAWLYNPGQRRVRRAPNVAHDNPRTAADGLATSDQLDIFNGSPERYNWNLVGRKEMLVPYNSYKLHSNQLKYSDILKPLHINQEHARYELHRVWVVDATLKEGTRHVYKRRTFYIDEDSWQAMVVDCYDNRDQIWRVQEAHSINYYDVPTFWTTLELTWTCSPAVISASA
jgi:hypothetical protein